MKTLQFFVCTIFCLSVLFVIGCDDFEYRKQDWYKNGKLPPKIDPKITSENHPQACCTTSQQASSESSDQRSTTSTQENLEN